MALLSISNFASKILIFFLVPLYTSVLSTTEYGIYDLSISTVSLLFPIFTLNIVDAVMRFTMDENIDKKSIATIGIKYILFSIAGVALFLFILGKLNIWQDIEGLKIYLFAYYTLYAFNQFFIQFAKGNEKVSDMSIAGVLSTVVMIVLNIICLLVLKWGLKGFFIANILSQGISAFYLGMRLHIWNYIEWNLNNTILKKEMLLYSTPLITTVVGWWINSTADKYAVTILCGVAINGIFSVAYKIPQILNTFQSIFIQAWQISAIKEYGKEDTAEFYGRSFSIIIVLMCAVCSWLIFLDKPLARLLYANDFYSAWEYVPFLLISSVINCAAGLLGPILSAKKNSRPMAFAAIYGTITNIIMNIVLVILIGAQGATIATVISSLVIYYIRKKAVGKEIIIDGYFTIIITWGLLCLQAIIEIMSNMWYVEIIIMITMLMINRRNCQQVIQMGKALLRH